MIHTKLTRGNRCLNTRNVSAEKRVPNRPSIAVAMMRRPSQREAALARRAGSGAMPAWGFSGLPGETISHTCVRRKRRNASLAIWRWP